LISRDLIGPLLGCVALLLVFAGTIAGLLGLAYLMAVSSYF
jgi:hypothetical protein